MKASTETFLKNLVIRIAVLYMLPAIPLVSYAKAPQGEFLKDVREAFVDAYKIFRDGAA